jgi:hypothetical protein
MIVLAAWISLSAGIVIGALWKSFCEQQSRRRTNLDDNMDLHPLGILEWQEYVTLRHEHYERSMPLSSAGHVNRSTEKASVTGTEVWIQPSGRA